MEPFLDFIWGSLPCSVQIARMKDGDSDTFKRVVAKWPDQREVIFDAVRENAAQGYDVFFGPATLHREATSGDKSAVSGTRVLWADFDGGAPENWAEYCKKQGITTPPSAIVQSSVSDRQHVYWSIAGTDDATYTDIGGIEDRNRALAARLGADKSGWDANQLLRIPGTTNFGWRKKGEHKAWFSRPVEVTTLVNFGTRNYAPADFSGTANLESVDAGSINDGDIIPPAVVMAERPLSGFALEVFTRTAADAKEKSSEGRSGSLMALIYTMIEQSYTDEQIFSLAYDAAKRWGKYFDSRSEKAARAQIAKDIAFAHKKTAPLDTTEAFVEKVLTQADPIDKTPQELKIWTFDEFMAEDFKFDWLVKDMLITNGFGLFTGQPNVGKTTQSLHLAMSVASGIDYIDYEVADESPVFFLGLEMPPVGTQHFLKDLAKPYDKARLNKNFKMSVPGQMLDLTNPHARKWFEGAVEKLCPRLVIVDSLRYLMKSLNDEEQVRIVLDFLQTMRNKHEFTMLAVHHDRKKQHGNVTGESSDLYGSQHIAADVDFALSWGINKADPARGMPIDMPYRDEIKNRYAARRTMIPVTYNGLDRRVNLGNTFGTNQEGTGNSPDSSGEHDSPRKPDDPDTYNSTKGISY